MALAVDAPEVRPVPPGPIASPPVAGPRVLPSGRPAGPRERALVSTVVLLSAAIFLALVPFAKTPLLPVWAFIPLYESSLIITDLITAVLLYGQFNFSRSRGVMLLACGYLFTA